MRKVLLVIEDYNEARLLESLLRRSGFDVMSVAKEILIADTLLKFSPEIAISTAKGRTVDGFRVAARLKKSVPHVRNVLIFPSAQAGQIPEILSQQSRAVVDAVLESPVQPLTALKIVAQLAGMDAASLIAKHEKHLKALGENEARSHGSRSRFVNVDPETTARLVSWEPGEAAHDRTARSDRYERFLNDTVSEPVDGVMPRDKAAAAMKKLKEDSAPEREKLAEIDREKREFAKALFVGESGSASASAANSLGMTSANGTKISSRDDD